MKINRVEDSAAFPTTLRTFRFNVRARVLSVAKYKTLAVGSFGSAHLEEGDGYIVVAGEKVLLKAKQIAKLEATTNIDRPTVVCLCGSTKFWRQFQRSSLAETMAGRIILSIGAATGTDDEHFGNLPQEEYDAIKEKLDVLHLRKIDLADEILVLNVGDYVGESAARELKYARDSGVKVRWLERSAHMLDGETIG